MQDIAQKQIFFFLNYHSWIRIRIWWWNFRIRQKFPDPTGSGSATLLCPHWTPCKDTWGTLSYSRDSGPTPYTCIDRSNACTGRGEGIFMMGVSFPPSCWACGICILLYQIISKPFLMFNVHTECEYMFSGKLQYLATGSLERLRD